MSAPFNQSVPQSLPPINPGSTDVELTNQDLDPIQRSTRTPEQWLPLLTRRVDYNWTRVELLRSYCDGNAPMPELGRNTKEAWMKFQKEARTNWGLLIVEAVVNRLIPNGITVGGSATSPAAKRAQRIWRNNRMDQVFRDWVRFGLMFRQSYLTTWAGDDGDAILTADSPETMYASVDPLQPWKVRAAVRWWRDLDIDEDRCIVWSQDSWQMFSRKLLTQGSENQAARVPVRLHGQWDPIGPVHYTGNPPPVAVYNNPGFSGEYETHIDLINRVNRGILERLTTQALQAFRQRAMKGGLPERDARGNRIDWAQFFEPAPGVIWDLPEGIDIWESQPTDIRPMLDSSKDDIRQLSAVTRTPLPVLMPDNANQTAEGADAARDGHIFKCGERLTEAQSGLQMALRVALSTEGIEIDQDTTIECIFKPVDRVTVAEMYLAAMNAKNAGESWASIARNILGYSPEQIAQDMLDRTQEALLMASFAPPPPESRPPGSDDGDQVGTSQRLGQPPRPLRSVKKQPAAAASE